MASRFAGDAAAESPTENVKTIAPIANCAKGRIIETCAVREISCAECVKFQDDVKMGDEGKEGEGGVGVRKRFGQELRPFSEMLMVRIILWEDDKWIFGC